MTQTCGGESSSRSRSSSSVLTGFATTPDLPRPVRNQLNDKFVYAKFDKFSALEADAAMRYINLRLTLTLTLTAKPKDVTARCWRKWPRYALLYTVQFVCLNTAINKTICGEMNAVIYSCGPCGWALYS